MTTSINDYVCNLIAGRTSITNLYFAVDKARTLRSESRIFCYKVNFPGIGNKVYNATQLVNLDDTAFCTKMTTLLAQIDGVPTVDQYVLVLLKAKNELRNLYQARYRALYIRSSAKIFCYTFTNPFGSAAGVNKNRLAFNNATNFLNFFCECEKNRFNALLVLGGID